MEAATNNESIWHSPQRQSPAAIFIILWSTSLKLLKGFWPVLLLYFFKGEKDENSVSIFFIIVAFTLISLLGTVISYWFKKFYISEDNLIVKSGWLRKKSLSIPFQNIQAVHLEQNVWQQALNVSKVSFDATGSEKVEVQLDALSTKKAEDLKDLLMNYVKVNQAVGRENIIEENDTYTLPFGDLIKLSLTANHLEAFLILLALGFNVLEEIRSIFDFDEQEYLDTYGNEIFSQTLSMAFLLFLGVAFISIVFSIARTATKFFKFSLVDNHKEWKITFGLFNREQKTIPLKKIQILSWRASWLRRKFNYWIMQVQTVGANKKSKKEHIQIPVLASAPMIHLANAYQKFEKIDQEKSESIAAAYWKRKVLTIALPLAIVPTLISWNWFHWWSFLFLVISVYLTAYFYKSWKNFRWQGPEEGIQLQSGAWGRKFTLLNWSKIQQVQIHQNIYQRKHQLANVLFITAGGNVKLPYISLGKATSMVDYVLYYVESKEQNWM